MNPQNRAATGQRKPGTFVKGDPRINRGGRPKAVLSHALMATMTDEAAEQILQKVVAKALDGDLVAVAMLWDRSEGKAIGRNEAGQPGEFTGLEDKSIPELIELAQRRA